MTPTRFARINADPHHPQIAVGDVVEIAFFERAYMPGFGLEQQIVGIKVQIAPEEYVTIDNRAFEYVSPAEAKAWHTEQKRARSRARRGLQ